MTAAELRDVAAAGLALLRAELRVRTRPTGRLIARLSEAAGSATAPSARGLEGGLEATVRRATIALDRAVRRGPLRPNCLVRSLALADLLARRGVPRGLIRIGVRREPGQALDAHAWVELDGRVVGDDPRHVRRFTPLGAVAPVPRR